MNNSSIKSLLKFFSLAFAVLLLQSCGSGSDNTTDIAPESLNGLRIIPIDGVSLNFVRTGGGNGNETGNLIVPETTNPGFTVIDSAGTTTFRPVSRFVFGGTYTYTKTGSNSGTLILNAFGSAEPSTATVLPDASLNIPTGPNFLGGTVTETIRLLFASNGGRISDIKLALNGVEFNLPRIETQTGGPVPLRFNENSFNSVNLVRPIAIFPRTLSRQDVIFEFVEPGATPIDPTSMTPTVTRRVTLDGLQSDNLNPSNPGSAFIEAGITNVDTETSTTTISNESRFRYDRIPGSTNVATITVFNGANGSDVYTLTFTSLEIGNVVEQSTGLAGTFDIPFATQTGEPFGVIPD